MRKKLTIKLLSLFLCITTLTCILNIGAHATDNNGLSILGASIRYMDENGVMVGDRASGLRFAIEIDKQSSSYKDAVSGDYTPDNEMVKFGILIIPSDRISIGGVLNRSTENVLEIIFDKVYSQDENTLRFSASLLGIPAEELDRDFSVRAFIKTANNGKWRYKYSKETVEKNFVDVGNNFYYDNRENTELCARLDEIFAGCDKYLGQKLTCLKFSVFSDFHYWDDKHILTVSDMDKIFERADKNTVDFIIQLGDFCYDWLGSPELVTKAYLNNKYSLPAYGLIGNHDLEVEENEMSDITPKLNNRDVIWGTADGKADPSGAIAYFYYEINGMRVICLDTNYSYNPTTQKWEHNKGGSYGKPANNQYEHSLGSEQLLWLENVLNDAANKQISCIVASHQSMSGLIGESPDAPQVREMFATVNAKQKGTVLMAINGHLHKDAMKIIDGVFYMNVNVTRIATTNFNSTHSDYNDDKITFEYVKYNLLGNPISTTTRKVSSVYWGNRSWYYEEPLSAIVTVWSNGKITVEGMESKFVGGKTPTTSYSKPLISGGIFDLNLY